MKLFNSRRDIYIFVLRVALIFFFTIAVATPFLISNDKELYLAHIFNPTNKDFSGRVESLYSYVVIIMTYLTLIASFFPQKTLKRKSIIILSFEISIFEIFIFSIMNYFRVIYPSSFLEGFDHNDLYGGMYVFVFFIILLLIVIVIDSFSVKNLLSKEKELSDLNKQTSVVKHKLIVANDVMIAITIFGFISLFFVPFISNYTAYMPEEGFQHILDKRTSVDYYLMSMFDSTFSLTLPSIITIWIAAIIPSIAYTKSDNKGLTKLLVATCFLLILLLAATLFGITNMSLIKPALLLKVNNTAIFFLVLTVLSAISVIVLTSIILSINRKVEKEYVDF